MDSDVVPGMTPYTSPPVADRWRFVLHWTWLWLLLALLPVQLCAAAPPTAEYKLKAALIYKLSKFVEWPDPLEAGQNGAFGICVLGEDPFGKALDALEARKTGGQPIRVYRFAQSEALDRRCRVVFISESKRPFLRPILQKLRRLPILSLSDMSGFAEQGGIMQFARGKKQIGFKINLQSARQAGLEIAAPLLELATIVKSPDR